jgi:hypothetical protein
MSEKKEEKKVKVQEKKEEKPEVTIYIGRRKFKRWEDVPESLRPKVK